MSDQQQVHEQPSAERAEHGPDTAALEAEVARLEDRFKRALADLDNFRKRSARELERRTAEATDAIVRDWLEVADSIERALASGTDGSTGEGLRAVAEQIAATLAREGVARVGTPGERFDPERHDAVDVRVTPGVADQTILDVVRSGYVRGDRVLRPAQVVVARRPPEAPATAPTEPAGPDGP
ncbi:nucleotide exchange factor GrpE [Baekduia sp.]|uniref:nucleotide exchange factor GrpE n=1 Tax=Baekduia sp. TaxID=2600305 RepID=UPI002D1FB0A7|nr:nucleotide exchange factor GrpE [Baekduia sp.]